MSIFDKRVNYKPFEYPEILTFTEAINKSFWVHSEVDFTADVQDFHSHLSLSEKEIIKRSLLAIAQIEVSVKSFWGNLYTHIPKPEFNGLGSTFAECEFRHSEAYSRLLDVLGYNNEFEQLIHVPVIAKRVEYLTAALSHTNVSNIIAWTSIDEQVHANAGIFIVSKIKEEFPEYFDELTKIEITELIQHSIDVEAEILDWIFESGELESISKVNLLNFMKYRVDDSLLKLDLPKIFNISDADYQPMIWFEEEVFANSLDDFFAKRPIEYTKHDKSITANDLF